MNALQSDYSNGNGMMDWSDVIRSDEDFSPTPFDAPEEECPDMDCYAESAPTEEYILSAQEITLPEMEYEDDGLPSDELFTACVGIRPKEPDELIRGILRKGQKMLISGPSKAAKSFLLMELAIAIATGTTWLGFQCRKSRVLYVNLELLRSTCVIRLQDMFDSLGVETNPENTDYLGTWNLRGKAKPLDELLPALIKRLKRRNYDVVIVDPIYKVNTGDENNARETAHFCQQFDRICEETGCAVIFCHHHSKGSQIGRNMIDRSSGSGVFARDPDAILDITLLQIPDTEKVDGATAWRMGFTLRGFPDVKPINFYFKYPVHTVDTSGTLAKLSLAGSGDGNLSKSPKRTTAAGRKAALDEAFCSCQTNGLAKVSEMSDYIGCTDKTIRTYVKDYAKEYEVTKGIVTRKSELQSTKEN